MIKSGKEIMDIFNIKEKVAVITGGASGIGLAIGWAYAASGAKVTLLDIDEKALCVLVPQFNEEGYAIETAICNVAESNMVENAFKKILDKNGHIDILVNSAGITLGKPAEQHTAEDFKKILDVNVVGTFNCCLAASRDMIKRGYGKIINIGSARGTVGSYVGHAAYGSSKGAVHMLTRQLATEWARYRINVNCIIPNLTRTPIAEYIMQNKDVYEFYMSRIPMRRPAETDDYVGAAIYLASAASDFVTGQLLYVDGGSMAG